MVQHISRMTIAHALRQLALTAALAGECLASSQGLAPAPPRGPAENPQAAARSVQQQILDILAPIPALDGPVGVHMPWGGAVLDRNLLGLDHLGVVWAREDGVRALRQISRLGAEAVPVIAQMLLQPRERHAEVLAEALCDITSASAREAQSHVAGDPMAPLAARVVCAARVADSERVRSAPFLTQALWQAVVVHHGAAALVPDAALADQARLLRAAGWAENVAGISARVLAKARLDRPEGLGPESEQLLQRIASTGRPFGQDLPRDAAAFFLLIAPLTQGARSGGGCVFVSPWGDLCRVELVMEADRVAALAPALAAVSKDYARAVHGRQSVRTAFVDLAQTEWRVLRDALSVRVAAVTFHFGWDAASAVWTPEHAACTMAPSFELDRSIAPALWPRVMAWGRGSPRRARLAHASALQK